MFPLTCVFSHFLSTVSNFRYIEHFPSPEEFEREPYPAGHPLYTPQYACTSTTRPYCEQYLVADLRRRLPSDRWNWSDESGVYERTREGYALPSSQWQWADEQWTVETRPNITDKDGWQYAVDFPRFGFISL